METSTARKLRQVDTWYWAYHEALLLAGKPFETKGHEYQVDILQCDFPHQCAKKGAQMGFTEVGVLKTLHGHIYQRYPQGTLYLFPTRDDVTDFSKGRFQPLIEDNPQIGQHVQNTDAANIKRVGNSMLYLRGARASGMVEGIKRTSSALKSIPVDRLVFDERDEMEPAMIDLAMERLGHSSVKEIFELSTPTIPEFGIDASYSKSDQRVWVIRCVKCSTETCLELEFPDCLLEFADGRVIRACRKCHAEIFPKDGRWIAQKPHLSNTLVGWWISQLNSIFVDPGEILRLYNDPPNGNLAEVYNSKLGMAYVASENKLTVKDVYEICGYDQMNTKDFGPCGMGVDVGDLLHVVIGKRLKNGKKRVVWLGAVPEFEDLYKLADLFNVEIAAIDFLPETRKAREFQDAVEFPSYLIQYLDKSKESQRVNTTVGLIQVNRTEMHDLVHNDTAKGRYIFPRRSEKVEEFAKHMASMVKVLEEDKRTRTNIYRYRSTGPDHYRHALAYFETIVQYLPETVDNPNQEAMQNILLKQRADEEESYDPLYYGLGGE